LNKVTFAGVSYYSQISGDVAGTTFDPSDVIGTRLGAPMPYVSGFQGGLTAVKRLHPLVAAVTPYPVHLGISHRLLPVWVVAPVVACPAKATPRKPIAAKAVTVTKLTRIFDTLRSSGQFRLDSYFHVGECRFEGIN
jgi:hypothetical protein